MRKTLYSISLTIAALTYLYMSVEWRWGQQETVPRSSPSEKTTISLESSTGTNRIESEITEYAASLAKTATLSSDPANQQSQQGQQLVIDTANVVVERSHYWRFIRREYETNERQEIARVFRADTILVGVQDEVDEAEIKQLVESLGLSIESQLAKLPVFKLRIPTERMDAFWELHRALMDQGDTFTFVEPEYLYAYAATVPNDPYLNDSGSWGIPAMNFNNAWPLLNDLSMTIAVIDSGIDTNHPDLSASLWTNSGEIAENGIDDDNNGYIDDVHGWNASDNNNDIQDSYGHGTAVAGIIAATHNNSREIAGAAPFARIMTVKNGAEGLISTADSAKALSYAVENGAQIVNMSFGSSNLSYSFDLAVSNAQANGVIMIASAGNDGENGNPNFPARFDAVISVGALDATGQRAAFSNYGSEIDLMAPGAGILSLRASGTELGSAENDYLTQVDGSSFAAPYISAAAALLLQKNPTWTSAHIKSALQSAHAPNTEWNIEDGNGPPDVLQAMSITAPITPTNLQLPRDGSVIRNALTLALSSNPSSLITLYYREVDSSDEWVQLDSQQSSYYYYNWDASEIPDGKYVLRLELSNNKQSLNLYRTLYITHTAPIYEQVSHVNGSRLSTADINNDGQLELVYAPFRGLAAFTPNRGYLSGWPLGDSPYESGYSGNAFNSYGHNYGVPAFGDSDGDGQLEIAIFHAPVNNDWDASVLTVTDNSGQIIPNLVRSFDNGRPTYSSSEGYISPVFADLEADGRDEIIYVAASSSGPAIVHALKQDGTQPTGWPVTLPAGNTACYGTPAVADFNGDGSLEIALVSYQGNIIILQADGHILSNWPKYTGATVKSHFLAFADFDNDAELELFFASKSSPGIYIFEQDGSLSAGWPQSMSISSPPSIGNIDDDPELEIAFPSGNTQYVLNHDGSPLDGWPVTASSELGMSILVDIDNDGLIDVYSNEYSQRVMCWDRDGRVKAELGYPMAVQYYGISTQPVAGDFDGDGLLEVSATTYGDGLHLYQLNTPDLPGALEHGMFHQTPRRQNRYTAPDQNATLALNFAEHSSPALQIAGKGFLIGSRLFANEIEVPIAHLDSNNIQATLPAEIPEGFYSLTIESTNHADIVASERFTIVNSFADDSDNDGMPNGWELSQSLNPFDNGSDQASDGAWGDLDGDALPNLVEYALRENNFLANEANQLAQIIDSKNNRFHFTFDLSTGVACWISPDLQEWVLVNEHMDPEKFTYQAIETENNLHEIMVAPIGHDSGFIRFSVSSE